MTIQDLNTTPKLQSPEENKNINIKEKKIEENEINNNNYLNRKTLRGRKEKYSLPKNKLKCGICLEFYNSSSKELVSCSNCKCLFHYSCYNQCEISILNEKIIYNCIRCIHAIKINKNINDFYCFICGCSNGVLNKNHITNEFYHQICLNLINELKKLENDNISKDNIRKWRYKHSCKYCNEKLSKNKVVIKCKNPKCKQFFHIPCAIEKGMIFDLNFMQKYYNVSNFSEIPFYCSNHNKKISLLYKSYVLNGKFNEKNQTNNIIDINNNKEKVAFLECKKKNKIKKSSKKKSNNKIFFITTKNNIKNILDLEKGKNDIIYMNNNNNCNSNKEILTSQKRVINISKENIDNSFEEKNNNDIFYIDFEKIIKDNTNRNLFEEDLKINFPLYKSEKEDVVKENEENSLFSIH